jgi:hypothetical protein
MSLLSLLPAALSFSARPPYTHSMIRSARHLGSLRLKLLDNKQALVEWPSYSGAQFYRVNTFDETNHFKSISTIAPNTLLRNLKPGDSYRVVVTPMTGNNEGKILSQTLTVEVNLPKISRTILIHLCLRTIPLRRVTPSPLLLSFVTRSLI